jgi:EF hand
MRKHVLVLTTTAAILACGAIAASAQAPGAQTPGTQQSPTTQPKAENSDQDGFFRYHRGMMGMMGGGMMGRGYRHHDWCQSRGTIGHMMMRVIFSLMDADGHGKLTLQEFQAAHERIFKAMDTDHDGTVTLEEMEAFMRGTTRPASQQ